MQTKKVSLGVYMYVHMCVITINENSGRALEREQGEMYGRKQKEKMMQRCSVSKNKRSNFKKEGFLIVWGSRVSNSYIIQGPTAFSTTVSISTIVWQQQIPF